MRKILTLGILFILLLASTCVSQAGEPKLLWSYKADAGMDFADVAVSADGEYVAAGSSGFDDDVAKVYFFNREGELLWSYKISDYCSCGRLSISADGEYIAASGGGGWTGITRDEVYFFNRKGKLLWSHAIYHGKGDRGISEVAVSADGEYVAVGNSNSNVFYPNDEPTIYFFNREGELLGSYKTYRSVNDVAISADGEYIVAGSSRGSSRDCLDPRWSKQFEPIGDLYFFNRDGELLWIYDIGDIHSFVESISISADGEYIAASDKGYHHGKVYFFNKAGELLWGYKTEGSVEWLRLSMSADGEYIAAGEYDSNYPKSKVYFFNRTGGLLWNRNLNCFGSYVSVSADGEYIAAGIPSLNDTLYFFNRAGGLLWSCKMGGSVYSLSMSADGKYVVTGRYCDEVYFIDSGVITTPSPTSTPEHSSSTPETPSYEAIFAISGLLTVVYLLLRRKRNRAKRG